MSHYINVNDITDSTVKSIINIDDPRIESWLDNIDNEFIGLAESVGLYTGTTSLADLRSPIHPIVKNYLIALFCRLVCRDSIGSTDTDTPDTEVYRIKYDVYENECSRLAGQITREMLWVADGSLSQAERVGGGTIWLS
jgi:hypothetical protein